MYVHLGGSPVAPFGVFLAAVFTRDWRGLLKVGGLCALLTSPMLFHFLRYLDWYDGQRGHGAGSLAILTYLLATIFPLSIPSLPVELAWATGNGFPRELD